MTHNIWLFSIYISYGAQCLTGFNLHFIWSTMSDCFHFTFHMAHNVWLFSFYISYGPQCLTGFFFHFLYGPQCLTDLILHFTWPTMFDCFHFTFHMTHNVWLFLHFIWPTMFECFHVILWPTMFDCFHFTFHMAHNVWLFSFYISYKHYKWYTLQQDWLKVFLFRKLFRNVMLFSTLNEQKMDARSKCWIKGCVA